MNQRLLRKYFTYFLLKKISETLSCIIVLDARIFCVFRNFKLLLRVESEILTTFHIPLISFLLIMESLFSEESLKKVQRVIEVQPRIEKKESKGTSNLKKRNRDEISIDEKTLPPVSAEHKDADRTIFIGNLSMETTAKDLRRLFEPFGSISSIRIRSIPIAGTKVSEPGNQALVTRICLRQGLFSEMKHSQNAYLVFEDISSIDPAINALNNALLHQRHIRVDTATPRVFPPSRTLFLGNLPYDTDEEEIRTWLNAHLLGSGSDKEVEGVRVVRDENTMRCRGIAYVLCPDTQTILDILTAETQTTHTGSKASRNNNNKNNKSSANTTTTNNSVALVPLSKTFRNGQHSVRIMRCHNNHNNNHNHSSNDDSTPRSKRPTLSPRDGRNKPEIGSETSKPLHNALRRINLKQVSTKKKFLRARNNNNSNNNHIMQKKKSHKNK
jgi:RNA recognition motif-containing protein